MAKVKPVKAKVFTRYMIVNRETGEPSIGAHYTEKGAAFYASKNWPVRRVEIRVIEKEKRRG